MEKFDKQTLQLLRKAMEKALKEVGVDGVEFQVGRCTYEPSLATFKVEAKIKGGETFADQALQSYAKTFGLALKKNGRILEEYNTRRHKYPFVYRDVDGKRYKCSPIQARALFGQ